MRSNLAVLQKIIITCCALLSAQVAQGVTGAAFVKDTESVDSVTTSAAVRANADVQIRRIKNLMVLKKTDSEDQAMVRIQRLQRDLRGEK